MQIQALTQLLKHQPIAPLQLLQTNLQHIQNKPITDINNDNIDTNLHNNIPVQNKPNNINPPTRTLSPPSPKVTAIPPSLPPNFTEIPPTTAMPGSPEYKIDGLASHQEELLQLLAGGVYYFYSII